MHPDADARVRQRLIEACRARELVQYSEIMELAELESGPHTGGLIGQLLGRIVRAERDSGFKPMLSAVAVGAEMTPGPGFFAFARQLGLLRAGEDKDVFHLQQLQACYEHFKTESETS